MDRKEVINRYQTVKYWIIIEQNFGREVAPF